MDDGTMTEQAACAGFRAAAVAAGLKKRGGLDLGLIVCDEKASAAGVFTTNRVQAAPVILSRERLGAGVCRAVVANAGNANCCTGQRGMEDARAMARSAADALGIDPEEVLVASTGVIGQPLPAERVAAAMPGLVKKLSPAGFSDFASAIMTTDLVPKIAVETTVIDGRTVTVTGVAKGSGMIRPDMATMLCFVCVDAEIDSGLLRRLLADGVDRTFNRITVDGDTSTNDMALILASGRSGAVIAGEPAESAFGECLAAALARLARMVVKDGEGATKLVDIIVEGAKTAGDARRVADAVAHSSLVKTALFGQDANWGRIIAAAGRSGADIDPDRIEILFDDVTMVADGMGLGPEAEAAATAVLHRPEFAIRVRLHQGVHSATMLTCDFSLDYVRINADYRS